MLQLHKRTKFKDPLSKKKDNVDDVLTFITIIQLLYFKRTLVSAIHANRTAAAKQDSLTKDTVVSVLQDLQERIAP